MRPRWPRPASRTHHGGSIPGPATASAEGATGAFAMSANGGHGDCSSLRPAGTLTSVPRAPSRPSHRKPPSCRTVRGLAADRRPAAAYGQKPPATGVVWVKSKLACSAAAGLCGGRVPGCDPQRRRDRTSVQGSIAAGRTAIPYLYGPSFAAACSANRVSTTLLKSSLVVCVPVERKNSCWSFRLCSRSLPSGSIRKNEVYFS